MVDKGKGATKNHPTGEIMRLTVEKNKRVDIPGDEDGGFINIKLLSLHEIARIEAKCQSPGINEKAEVTLALDPFSRENMIALSCLTGWGNMYDSKGKELKFNRKSLAQAEAFVIRVDDKKMRFLEWVDHEHAKFYEEVEDESKVAIKN